MVRAPDFDRDGWCLEDAEERHRDYPSSFELPDRWIREVLEPGDFAKLIFRIAVENEDGEAVERMWVIVRSRVAGGYVGTLDNNPTSIVENGSFWRGTELPFQPRHIIDVARASPESLELIAKPPAIPWRDE